MPKGSISAFATLFMQGKSMKAIMHPGWVGPTLKCTGKKPTHQRNRVHPPFILLHLSLTKMNGSPSHMPPPTLKLLLIGDSGTGKSSILLRFVDDKFLGEEVQSSTIGVDFKVKLIQSHDKTVKLTIWDTAGQERFRTLTSSYYRGAHGVILVYDITRRDTFEHLGDWMSELEVYSNIQSSIKMVIGNKSDKTEERQVAREQGVEYAKKIGALFMESSAKSNVHIQDAFEELVFKILEHPDLIDGTAGRKQRSLDIHGMEDTSSSCSC